ncbi:MAG: TetR family transcriptional regulator [Candidatus Abyssobacteria bacterium SURF_17]|jgi:AcrR family transcriptional regulator|uniref:TetR family transcriptional regulator n=1 Tax=Candidatus Abyssobacteria bacterium SURF_17 TaxID=2093361 RepID=A0A419ERA3_9BACT|nr:MAG: TetR family transcriptional regulator [Candidatus Abyssubacteria bacterium SURF_17]
MGRKSLAGERRAQILDALARCISRHGLQGSPIKTIAKEAGVQPSILYHYFKDRDEMIEELVDKLVDNLMDSYSARIRGYKEPEKRFEKGLEFLFSPEMQNTEPGGFYYSCIVEAKRNPRVQRSMTKLFRRYRAAVLQLLIETGKTAGLSSREAKDLASMLVAIQDGVALQRHMDGTNISMERMHHLTRSFIRLYLDEKTKRQRRKTP